MSVHLSSREISQWLAGIQPEEAERHLRECPQCAGEIESLGRTLVLFRESGERWSENCQAQPKPASASGWMAGRLASAIAAAVVLAVVLIRPAPAPRAAAVENDTPFIQFPFVAPLAPYERVSVVRTEVPVAELVAAGFEMHAPDTGASVLADLVLGQDGRPFAIRFISNRRILQ